MNINWKSKKLWIVGGIALFLIVFFTLKVANQGSSTLYDVLVWNFKNKDTSSYIKEGSIY